MQQHASQRDRPFSRVIQILLVVASLGILGTCLFVLVLGGSLIGPGLDGPMTSVANDLHQLTAAVDMWKKVYKVKFAPPSQLFLSNNYNDYLGDSPAAPAALRQQSLSYLTQLWPRMPEHWNNSNPFGQVPPPPAKADTRLDWSGGLDAARVLDTGGMVLQGDQCLVFFLGGIPRAGRDGFHCTRFSTNPRNPTQAGDPRVPPEYEFLDHLYQRPCTTAAGGSVRLFLSYRDWRSTYQNPRPYVYFSSGKRKNGYDSLGAAFPDVYTGPGAPPGGVAPYHSGANQYLNPTTCQIISAGRDQSFGPGGRWDPAAGFPAGSPGADDQSNFSDHPLGAPR